MNKIAIVVGHDKIEQGAYSHLLKQSEFAYNSEIAKLLPFDIYFRPTSGNYYQKMVELSKQINGKGYSLVVELHFNSFNGVVNGCEALYFDNSAIGKRYAEIYCKAITNVYKTSNRGAKEIKATTDRGYWFHKLIDAPTLILEPFFADNKESLLFKDFNKHAKILIEIFC